jgi:hypothetical protein
MSFTRMVYLMLLLHNPTNDGEPHDGRRTTHQGAITSGYACRDLPDQVIGAAGGLAALVIALLGLSAPESCARRRQPDRGTGRKGLRRPRRHPHRRPARRLSGHQGGRPAGHCHLGPATEPRVRPALRLHAVSRRGTDHTHFVVPLDAYRGRRSPTAPPTARSPAPGRRRPAPAGRPGRIRCTGPTPAAARSTAATAAELGRQPPQPL